MKLSTLLDRIIEKADLPNEAKGQLIEKVAIFGNQELPDELTPIVQTIEQLHTERSALANRNIVEKAYDKKIKELQKSLRSRLGELGLSQPELDEILAGGVEEAFINLGKKLEEQYRSKFSLSESERIKQEEELRKQEKERAERLQSQLLEIERRYKTEIENERASLRLQYLISQTPKNEIMPADKANKIIFSEVLDMIKRDNAKLVEIGGQLRVVSVDDETLDVFDERNVRVTIDDYIRRALKEMKLEAREKVNGNKYTINMSNHNGIVENSTTRFLKSLVSQKNK